MTGEKTYEVSYGHDGYYEDQEPIEASSLEDALAVARDGDANHDGIEDWIRSGDWGDLEVEGGSVTGYVEVTREWEDKDGDEDSEEASDSVEVVFEHNEEEMVRRVGGDPECDHKWDSTLEIEGGIKENPGVWGLNGAAISSSEHCTICGVRRTVISGDVNQCGNRNSVTYEVPLSRCPRCREFMADTPEDEDECDCGDPTNPAIALDIGIYDGVGGDRVTALIQLWNDWQGDETDPGDEEYDWKQHVESLVDLGPDQGWELPPDIEIEDVAEWLAEACQEDE